MSETSLPARQALVRRLRRVLVLIHMTTAFGWLTSAVAVLVLTFHGLTLGDENDRLTVFEAAVHLDDNLLADFSFMTVYTGLMLAGMSHWGLTRFWWVTVKLVLAITCALGGRALLTAFLADDTSARNAVPDLRLVCAAVLMIAAITFMAWIARAKPWGRIRAGRGPTQAWGHPALYAVVIVTPVLDYVTGLPLQAVPAAVVLGYRARNSLVAYRRASAAH
jgi:hypothetical protein